MKCIASFRSRHGCMHCKPVYNSRKSNLSTNDEPFFRPVLHTIAQDSRGVLKSNGGARERPK